MGLPRSDHAKAREWVEEFLRSNPGASVHQTLKAMTNARQPPVDHIVKEVHARHAREKLEAMTVTPARPEIPNGPKLIIPAHQEDTMPPTVSIADKPAAETADLKRAAQALLDAMRRHNIASCILTLTDADRPRAEWEVEYRSRTTGGVDL